MAKRTTFKHNEESSESENETEPSKSFHRRCLSTNVKSCVSIITFIYKFAMLFNPLHLMSNRLFEQDIHKDEIPL
jgi:hypothetical protein